MVGVFDPSFYHFFHVIFWIDELLVVVSGENY